MKLQKWHKYILSGCVGIFLQANVVHAHQTPKQQAEEFSQLAYQFLRADKLSEALASYQQAIKYNTNDAGIYNNIGYIYLQQKQYPEAYIAFEAAIRINPLSADTWTNLGTLYYKQNRIYSARKAYQMALKYRPFDLEVRQALSIVEQQLSSSSSQ